MLAMTFLIAGSLYLQPMTVTTPPPTTDHKVIESVLEDLLTAPKSPLEPSYDVLIREIVRQSKLSRKNVKSMNLRSDVVFFSPIPLLGKMDVSASFRVPEKPPKGRTGTPWKDISPSKLVSAHEAEADMAKGHPGNVSYSYYKPRDSRIVLYRERRDTTFRFSKQVFEATPPGYSKDGQVAAVYLRFPWSGGRHSGEAVYLLESQIGGWKVIARQFRFAL